MLDNCLYDQVKLLHALSCQIWFIQKHAKEDARKAGDNECLAFLERLEKDLAKHVEELKKMVCKSCE